MPSDTTTSTTTTTTSTSTSTSSRRSFLRALACTAAGAGICPATRTARAANASADRAQFRFAICNETFGDWPIEKVCDFAAQCGYRGLEIAPFTFSNNVRDISAQTRRTVRREAEKAGLQVVGLHWLLARTQGLHLTSPDAAIREQTGQYLGELARFCADLGGSLLVFGSPQQRSLAAGVSAEQGREYASQVLTSMLPLLESLKLTLALEPLSRGTTNFLSTAAEAARLIEQLKSPHVRLILDCLAMSTEATPIPALIQHHAAQLAHFHANDPNRQGPGFGKLDFVPILRALRQIDYQGWVSLEVFDYSPGPERLARDSIHYLRQCAQQI